VSTANVQVEEVMHEEADQQLRSAVQQEADNEDYYADLFLYKD
jgi:hypothetical protein